MGDQNFKNMMLLGMMNIQWMLTQVLLVDKDNKDEVQLIRHKCRSKLKGYKENVGKYIDQ